MTVAKAVAGFLTALVVTFATEQGIELDSAAVEALVVSLITALVVWAVPNRRATVVRE